MSVLSNLLSRFRQASAMPPSGHFRMRRGKAHFTILAGLTCAGKSTYLNDVLQTHGIMARAVKQISDIPENGVLHYNLARYARVNYKKCDDNFLNDELLSSIFSTNIEHKIKFIFSTRIEVIHRIIKRKTIENNLGAYENIDNLLFLLSVDYRTFMNKWLDLFISTGSNTEILFSHNGEFQTVTREQFQGIISNDLKIDIDLAKIGLRHFSQGYQSMEFKDGGIHSNRRSTLDAISRHVNLTRLGSSVLDVGSASGYFCFEFERMGFNTVLGLEPRKNRYVSALMMGEALHSKVDFLGLSLEEFWHEHRSKTFDIVNCLNVIHHVPNFVNFLQLLARLCSRLLILEFPTPEDERFQNTVDRKVDFSGLPLIAVSSVTTAKQTYVYTKEALDRLLIQNTKSFKNSFHIESPISGRLIGFYEK